MINGIDVSEHQGNIDWKKVAASGVRYAGIRCTRDGHSRKDVQFERNYDGARENGVLPFPYLVLRFHLDADGHVEFFIDSLGGRKTWMNIMDVEVVGGAGKTERGKVLHYTMAGLENQTHAMSTIYTNKNFWDTYMPSRFLREFDNHVLWVASYGRNDGKVPPHPPYPTLPKIWRESGAWQYTDRGRVDGINANVDLDLMEDELYFNLRARSGIPEPGGTQPPEPPEPPEPPDTGLELRVNAIEREVANIKNWGWSFPT